MATPRRRRRSVAEIEALANKPTKAKRALPKSRAALVGSGARTYPQAKSPAPKPKRKPAKTVAEIERRANKPTPTSIVPPSPIRLLDRPQPAQLPLPPDLGVFGRTVPKRGVHPRGRTRRRR